MDWEKCQEKMTLMTRKPSPKPTAALRVWSQPLRSGWSETALISPLRRETGSRKDKPWARHVHSPE